MAGPRRCWQPTRRSGAGTKVDRLGAPLSSQDIGRLRQAALLGLARASLSVPASLQPLVAAASPARESALTVLALAGQQQRFQRLTLQQAAQELPDAARHL